MLFEGGPLLQHCCYTGCPMVVTPATNLVWIISNLFVISHTAAAYSSFVQTIALFAAALIAGSHLERLHLTNPSILITLLTIWLM